MEPFGRSAPLGRKKHHFKMIFFSKTSELYHNAFAMQLLLIKQESCRDLMAGHKTLGIHDLGRFGLDFLKD